MVQKPLSISKKTIQVTLTQLSDAMPCEFNVARPSKSFAYLNTLLYSTLGVNGWKCLETNWSL